MEPSPNSRSYMSSMSSVGQLLLDNERAVRKLNKVRQRRDHYARLYFNTLSELEETKWKLNQAMKTIKELKTQGHVNSNSMPTVRRRVFHSNTTSPDSGASLSPGVESVEFARQYPHSNPQSSHSHSVPTHASHPHSIPPHSNHPHSVPPHSNPPSHANSHSVPPHANPPSHANPHSVPPHANPHSISPPSNPHSGHRGPVSGSQYGNEPSRVPERVSEARWRGKPNPSYYSATQGQGGGGAMSKPHPSMPLVLHPPPASRGGGRGHLPPPQHHPSAFSPTRPNFVKSWSLSVSNLAQQESSWQQQQQQYAGQKLPHPPATPITASSSTVGAFTLPDSYRGEGPGGSHAYLHTQQHHAHLDYPPHQQQRSMTLPHSHAHHPVSRQAGGPRTQYTSLSQDDLLDRPTKTAFPQPTSNPHYSAFLKHYPDNLEIPAHPGNHDNGLRDNNTPHTPGTPAPPTKLASTKEEEREEEEEEGGYVCSNLTSVDMLDLLLNISSPHCQIRKLEIQHSQLGEPEAMKLLCNSLARNSSITELSLPENGIGRDALIQLLETIKIGGTSIKELKLRKNAIGQDCADLIKEFLTQTTLDSLVLTGNEIEQYGHLLDGQLPNEFSMEYSSDDSGVHTVTPSTNDPSPQISDSFKYLRL